MSQTCFILSFFLLFMISSEGDKSVNQTGKVTWSIKSPCKQCVHIVMCPVICGKKISTTPQPRPTTKPPPTKPPLTPAPPVIPSRQPPVPPPKPPPVTPAPPTKPVPLTPAPPVIPSPQPPVPPPKPPPVTPAPPTKPAPLTPAPPVIPSPQPPVPPPKPPPVTPAPPIRPAPVTQAPPVIPSPQPPVPPPKPPPVTPAPPIRPAPVTQAPPVIPSPQVPVHPPNPTPSPPMTPAPPIQPPLTPTPPVTVPTSAPVPSPPTTPGELSCQVTFEKKGCFKDDQKPPRPLPNYILTDRDSSLKIYSGKEIDWGNWVNYLPDFVCRCAQLAKSKNFKFFGIQYYGECWSGPSRDENLFKNDGNSTECVNTEWKACSDQSKLACAGKQFSNYVYAIV